MSVVASPLCKRLKTDSLSFDHDAWIARGKSRGDKDFLKALYPHARDRDCFMEEATHTYYVRSCAYTCSVSSVWKVFFEDFDADPDPGPDPE